MCHYLSHLGSFGLPFFGTSFFVNSLHYGSVLGATIAGTGYLLIMWSQAPKDDQKGTVEENYNHQLDSDDQTTPLLLGNGDVDQV
uniref:WAT1-related protein n=1 Tax=Noccaea caerulescens TaxID=107243 RepID=A0A1J3CYR2_NOCCA